MNTIKSIINTIKEFLIYQKIRNDLDISEMSPALRYKLKTESSELEKELNKVLMYNLARRMIRENISPEYAAGFKSALTLRVSLINNEVKEDSIL